MSDSPVQKEAEEFVAVVTLKRKSSGEVVNTVNIDKITKIATNQAILQYHHSNGRRIFVPGPVHKFTLEGEIFTSAEDFIKYVDTEAKPALADISASGPSDRLDLKVDEAKPFELKWSR